MHKPIAQQSTDRFFFFFAIAEEESCHMVILPQGWMRVATESLSFIRVNGQEKKSDSSLIGIENSIFPKTVQSLEMESKCQCSR